MRGWDWLSYLKAVARIVVVAVALAVHARPFVADISLAVFARFIPSSVRHRSLLAWVLAVWVVREDALAVSARAGSGRRRSAGAFRRGVQGVVVLNLGSRSLRATVWWVRPSLSWTTDRQPTGNGY
jgi:hypothetical protein